MLLDQIFRTLKRHRKELETYGVKNIAIFGSTVRNEQKRNSDIDILIDFTPEKGLFGFIDLKFYLEKLLDAKVDLVMRDSLHPALKDQILKEAKNAF